MTASVAIPIHDLSNERAGHVIGAVLDRVSRAPWHGGD